jgi:rhs-family protein
LYISQDPIGLAGNNPNFYAYVFDSNIQVDVFGLDIHHLIPNAVFRNNRKLFKSIEGYIQNVSKKAQDKTNLLDLDKPFYGNHPKYNDYVEGEINNLKKGGLTLEKIKTLQDNLRNHVEKALENFKETGITLNDYFKKGLHKIEFKN